MGAWLQSFADEGDIYPDTRTPTSQYVHKQLGRARKVISCSRIVYLTEQETVNSPLTDRSFMFFFLFFFFRLGEIFIIDNPDILFQIF